MERLSPYKYLPQLHTRTYTDQISMSSEADHKYFALSSMLCMVMAIYTGHKMITGNRKEKAKKEKVTDREE